MVRKLKETADWFKHPCELRNTTQMRAIRRKFSNDGYAVYNYLIEMMCGAKNFELEYSKKLIALYCADFDVSEKKFTEIVDFCVAIDVFFIDKKNQKLTSPDLKEYLEGLLNFRERDRNRKANNHSHQIAKIHMENENIHMENGQSIEENRIEKKRKGKIITHYVRHYPYHHQQQHHPRTRERVLGMKRVIATMMIQ